MIVSSKDFFATSKPEHINQMQEAYKRLMRHFNDSDKVDKWLESNNPALGGITPLKMIEFGNGKQLLEFIDNAMENSPE